MASGNRKVGAGQSTNHTVLNLPTGWETIAADIARDVVTEPPKNGVTVDMFAKAMKCCEAHALKQLRILLADGKVRIVKVKLGKAIFNYYVPVENKK